MRVVVVGNGPASACAIEAFRQIDKDSEIIVLSDEEFPVYAPNCMENVIRNDISDESLFYKGGFKFYEKYKVDFRPNKKVISLNTKEKVVVTEDGDNIRYDRCLLAAGADSFIPPIEGLNISGITTAKNLYDAKRIRRWIEEGRVKRAVIVGAGPIGIEDAETLKDLGIEVTVVEIFDRVLPRMLDKDMADIYMRYLEEKGIKFLLNHQVVAFHGKEWVEKVEIKERGSDRSFFVEADMVILSVGVRPRTHIVKDTDIEIHIDKETGRPLGGILVDEHQRTSDPDVYAAGDICSSVDVFGNHRWIALFPAAQQEGYVAGYNLAGVEVKNTGSVDYNAVKTRSVTAGSGGIYTEADKIEKVEYENFLIKVFLREGKVIGYQFVGLPRRTVLNTENPLLGIMRKELSLWERRIMNFGGMGLEASGVLMHHFIRIERRINPTHVDVIKRGLLRSLGNPAMDTPLFLQV